MVEANTQSSTFQVVDLPVGTSDETVEDIFSEFGPLKRCFVVRPKVPNKSDKTSGYVQFAFSDDAIKASKALNGSIQIADEDYKIKCVPDKPTKNASTEEAPEIKKDFQKIREDVEYAKKKKARLVVRNLSFKATDESLRAHFEKCGKVEDVNILKKKDGKMVGCAFIQFSKIIEASNAIKSLNGKPFIQRPIAVDWAVPKKEYEQKSSEVKVEEEEDEKIEIEEKVDKNEIEAEENNGSMDEDSNDEDESDGPSDMEEEGMEEYDVKDRDKPKSWPKTGHDVAENKTVFIRNLSFDTDQEDLRDLMEEYFGEVFFAVLVKDKMTERPRGTAFVKFVSSESAEKCVKASETDGIFLDTRQIYAAMALPKSDADQKQKEKKKKEPKDTRNLYLAREGLIREGTLAANGVSKTDLEKRKKLERYKKQILQNLSMFVSPERLCIRNLPLTLVDNEDLLKVIKKYTDPKDGKITETRIMKDLKNGGQSKGYAFVSFSTHEAALKCLRNMNNNPLVFTKNSRPIIDFSIENRKAIQAREKRQQKSREKNPQIRANVIGKEKGKKMTKKPACVTPKIEGNQKPAYMGSQGDPKVKNLPSHTGPKIRHKTPKISRRDLQRQDKDKKLNKKRKREIQSSDKVEVDAKRVKTVAPPKSAKKLKQLQADREAEKKFSSLVQSYKTRMMSAEKSNTRSKWFE